MTKRLIALLALFGALFLAFAAPASATDAGVPVNAHCSTGWYVNDDGDENTRAPDVVDGGLEFSGKQLVHHAAEQIITLNNLNPGSYVSSPMPSLSDFFSVEIANPDGSAYATLRYDPAEGKWNIGGADPIKHPGAYTAHESNPVNFVGKTDNYGVIAQNAKVISFGVGYVKTPSDGADTVVSSVTFAGHKYPLTGCSATPSPSASASATGSASASASSTGGAVVPVDTGTAATLPVTGTPTGIFLLSGAAALVVGAVAVTVARRRRRT